MARISMPRSADRAPLPIPPVEPVMAEPITEEAEYGEYAQQKAEEQALLLEEESSEGELVAAQGDPCALEELTEEPTEEQAIEQAVEELHTSMAQAGVEAVLEDGVAQNEGAPAESKGRRNAKDKALDTVRALSKKVVDLLTFLEHHPGNEAIENELREANLALGRAIKLLDERPNNLGTSSPSRAPTRRARKTDIDVGDKVEIVAKYRTRFTFLKGLETGVFTVESLNGRTIGCKPSEGETLYIARGLLKLRAEVA